MGLADYLTTQICRGDITVEQAQNSLLAYAHRHNKAAGPPQTLIEIEARAIADSMQRNDDNVEHVAKELGISRTTLYRKIR